ncbi:MAG: hypothetical protein MI975_16075 [Cytophagales bacterium]|nr:hypothetical protein [Cytophagales bacterium]
MKPEKIKRDSLIKSIFDEGGIEQPSGKFTSQIINTIKAQTQESVFEYKPVISRKVWLMIAFLGVSLFLYLLLGFAPEGRGLNLYGYTLNIDTGAVRGILNKIAVSFELTPILKTSLIALTFFTFSNLIVFELKSRSFFK